MKYFIVSIISIIIGFSGSYLFYYFKYKNLEVLDKTEKEYEETIEKWRKIQSDLEQTIIHLNVQKEKLLQEKQSLSDSTTVLSNSLTKLKTFYENQQKDIVSYVSSDIERSINSLEDQFTKAQEECKEQYLILISDLQKEFLNEYSQKTADLNELEKKISHLREIEKSAVKMREQEYEKIQKKNFYRLILSEEDLEEIKELKEVAHHLRDTTPLNKVIWKVYYEKPYTDLVGRLLGSEVCTGIYKITNIENGMCYIGQAVNIANRIKQHIKRGLGAETPTKNKLYTAMKEFGVENFTFEVVQECKQSELNKQEDYWQDYFKAKEFGYSIK